MECVFEISVNIAMHEVVLSICWSFIRSNRCVPCLLFLSSTDRRIAQNVKLEQMPSVRSWSHDLYQLLAHLSHVEQNPVKPRTGPVIQSGFRNYFHCKFCVKNNQNISKKSIWSAILLNTIDFLHENIWYKGGPKILQNGARFSFFKVIGHSTVFAMFFLQNYKVPKWFV